MYPLVSGAGLSASRIGPGFSARGFGERLDLEVFLETRDAHLATQTGLFVPTKRYVGPVPNTAVNRHGSGADTTGDGLGMFGIIGEDRSRQSVDGIVGDGHGVIIVVVCNGHENWTEDLLLGDGHVVGDIGQDGG